MLLMVKVRFGEILQSTFCISADFVNPALTRGRRAGISLMSLMALTENEEDKQTKKLNSKKYGSCLLGVGWKKKRGERVRVV